MNKLRAEQYVLDVALYSHGMKRMELNMSMEIDVWVIATRIVNAQYNDKRRLGDYVIGNSRFPAEYFRRQGKLEFSTIGILPEWSVRRV